MLDREISNLLAYAQTGLLLDELDCSRAARRVCDLLGVVDFSPVEPDEGADVLSAPQSLLAPLVAYALETKRVDESGVTALKADIMDAVMLKPSEINDLFCDTYSVNKQKAFDWLYDYAIKCGYVDLEEIARNERWEAKELKSKIEIIINTMPQATVNKYPACALCRENEGLRGRANTRYIGVEIGDEQWYFSYSRHQYFDKHGVLVNGTHTPMAGDASTLKKLALAADFIGNDGFVCMDSLAENSGANNKVHEHFKTGFNAKNVPMLKRGCKMRVKCADYPYLEMGIVDWYPTVIRFAHSSLEKTVEFCCKLMNEWKAYSDERIVNDGSKNFTSIVCRKINGKYTFDVALRSNALKRPRMAADYEEIKADALSVTDLLGYFVLPNKLSEQLKSARLYLDGSLPFDPKAEKIPLAKTVERLLKAQGGTVTKLEAKLNIHDEVDIVCEKILASTAVFDEQTIADLFDALDIRVL